MKECKHKGAYRFHENAPMICPDCDNFVEYKYITDGIELVSVGKQNKNENKIIRRDT